MPNQNCSFCFHRIPDQRRDKRHPSVLYCSKECTKASWYRKKHPVKPPTFLPCSMCKILFLPSLWHPKASCCTKKCQKQMDYDKHKLKRIETSRKWIKANPDKVREYHRKNYWKYVERKRTQKRARLTASLSTKDWIFVCNRDGNECRHCGVKGDYLTLSIDHVIPVSLGGTGNLGNIQPLCLRCNQSKGNRFIG